MSTLTSPTQHGIGNPGFDAYDVTEYTEQERELLVADILAVAESLDVGFYSAQHEHIRRVGGQENLRSYTDTLLAQARLA